MSIQSTQASVSKLSFLPAIIFLALGGLILAISIIFSGQQQASQDWPSTEGIITKTYVDEYRDAEDSPSYTPKVVYQYGVEDQVYASQQLFFGFERSYGSQNKAIQALEAYPVGSQVTVYYDPADPGSAVLDRSASRNSIALWAGGGVTLIGLFLLVGAVRKRLVS